LPGSHSNWPLFCLTSCFFHTTHHWRCSSKSQTCPYMSFILVIKPLVRNLDSVTSETFLG
jgi:hypothetical protein